MRLVHANCRGSDTSTSVRQTHNFEIPLQSTILTRRPVNNREGEINGCTTVAGFYSDSVDVARQSRRIRFVIAGNFVDVVLPVPDTVAGDIDWNYGVACFGYCLFEVCCRDARYIVLAGFTTIDESDCFYWGSWLSLS